MSRSIAINIYDTNVEPSNPITAFMVDPSRTLLIRIDLPEDSPEPQVIINRLAKESSDAPK